MIWLQHTAFLMTLVTLASCASRPAPGAGGPSVPGDSTDQRLPSLLEARVRADGEAMAAREALEQFQIQHPDLADLREFAKQRVSQLSQALTAAEVDTIDVRSRHAEGHPAVTAALKRREEINHLLSDATQRLSDLNRLVADQERLRTDLAMKQEFARRLAMRIEQLRMRADEAGT